MIQASAFNALQDIIVKKEQNISLSTLALLVIIVVRIQQLQLPVHKVPIMMNYMVHLQVTVKHVLWVTNVQRHKLIEELFARKDIIAQLVHTQQNYLVLKVPLEVIEPVNMI